MTAIQHNMSLRRFNTFGLEVKARAFFSVDTQEDIQTLQSINWSDYSNKLIMGGGSNLLFIKDFDGIIIHQTFKEISILKEDAQNVWVEATAAVVWDDFVAWTVDNDFGGIENLSDIPGEVGASPVQNIGAYGVEAKDTIETVKGINLESGENFELSNPDCHFDYRDSIFKNELKGKALVTSVVYRLSKNPVFNISYGNVAQTVNELGEVSLKNIRKAIQQIRGSKLPDYHETGNAGSFFKNPVIDADQYKTLQEKYPDIPGYSLPQNQVKVPAAWLIDQSGLKGFSIGGAAVHENQPLVLINKNNATGNDVYQLAQHVIKTVKENFGIGLWPEVNIIG